MKTYNIPTRFVFNGVFKIRAKSKTKAEEFVRLHCGMVAGGNGVHGGIHSSLPDEDVDWEFPIHPEKQIIKG
jgi:hypothetical protein